MAKAHARPIKNKRDYKGAANVANAIRQQSERETAEELRLQALIRELEKFDDQLDDGDDIDASADIDGLPRRRWSDDESDPE
jgi:hypothetical protein